jgi:hypothetical protein
MWGALQGFRSFEPLRPPQLNNPGLHHRPHLMVTSRPTDADVAID